MVDFSLSEEQLLLQKTAREFGKNEIIPVIKEIEKMDRLGFTSCDLCQDVFKKATQLGFTTLFIPEKYGGSGMGCIESVLLAEELGTADVGIAAAIMQTIGLPYLIVLAGTEEQREMWLREICSADMHLLACGLTEADVAGSEVFCPYPDPKLGIRSYAKKEGEDYVINGSKCAFIVNAGVAKSYFLVVRTDMTKPASVSSSLFYIPANIPGLTIGKRTEMIGWRTVQEAELFFDNLRVSKELLLGKEGEASIIFFKAMPYLTVSLAACYVGLARKTYEYAYDYAKQRVSWGQPIIKHQAIALMIADMVIDIQAARCLVWDAAYAFDNRSELAYTIKAPSAKIFAVDIAIKASQNAIKILGGYGVTKEYETAKFLCDAWMGYACVTGDMLRLGIVDSL